MLEFLLSFSNKPVCSAKQVEILENYDAKSEMV